jgi:hypothetical protein
MVRGSLLDLLLRGGLDVSIKRQLSQLRRLGRRLRPGSVPGALVDVTTGGAFIRPIPKRNNSGKGGPAKWM